MSPDDLEAMLASLERRLAAPKWKPGDYCDRCNNTGEIDCHCGGDLCICGADTLECPQCGGRDGPCDEYPDDYDDQY